MSLADVPAAIWFRMQPWWQRHQSAAGHLLAAIVTGLAMGVMLPHLPLFLALALVPAAAAAWWMASRPEMGLLLIVAITGGLVNYDRLPYLSLGPVSLHVTDLLLLVLLGLAIVRLLVQRDFRYVSTGLDVPMLLFSGTTVIAVLTAVFQFGVSPNVAAREFRIVAYWLGFFAVTQLVRTKRQLSILITGLLILSVLMTGVVLLQMVLPSVPLVRVSSETLSTAGTEFADVSRAWISGERLIYVMLIVAVCESLLAPSVRSRLIYGGIAGFLFLWLFLSFQRNYWLTTALSLSLLGFVVPWAARLRALRWVLLGLVLVALLLGMPGSPLAHWGEAALDRLFSLFAGTRLERDVSVLLRQAELQYAFRQIVKYPVFGVGIGNAYRPWINRFDYRPDVYTFTSRGLTWYCHNVYVWIWVKMGTPALIFFLWLCFRFLYRGFRTWPQISDPTQRAVVLGFTLAFVGQMVSNLVAPNFIQSWVLIVFPIMMGINELIYKWNEVGQEKAGTEHAG